MNQGIYVTMQGRLLVHTFRLQIKARSSSQTLPPADDIGVFVTGFFSNHFGEIKRTSGGNIGD